MKALLTLLAGDTQDMLPKMVTRARGILLCFSAFSFMATAAQPQGPPQTETPDSSRFSVSDLIAQGTVFASQYFDNRRALVMYTRALKIESSNADLLWHISQAYIDIGEHLPTGTDPEKEQQLAMYEKALEFAEKSVAVAPQNSMALTRRAIAHMRVALYKGFWEANGLLKAARHDLENAIGRDSTNHLAFYAFGRVHVRALERPWILRWPLGLGWGEMEKAIDAFASAVRLKNDFICYRLEYAKALIEEGEYQKARDHLATIASLPTQDEDDDRYRRDAKELLESIREEEE